ncbi:hypothetical protein [Parazoarcus communis]|uniref:Uncharacterized protein n=1 Tax=Parazoarcus communis SWub3 = DSM 12120 TaxID=1121029 RepID=A0A323UUP0_9RHOO|nr:hypothetical protein [Parazoarcus communis]NMG71834.1 hypothetical protein [Parazoarcus communis SWub3 = DSM 12120]PZA14946.1 hypothetical protein DNK49_19065 [Azoarcus communis] [Parazoarcus communis SWub3 = DSM 12120]
MPEHDINVVLARLSGLSEDVGELKTTLREIATAVTRLALVEERQSQTNEALGRAFKQLDKVEGRVAAIERDMPIQRKTSGWVLSGVWTAAGLAVLFIAKKVGFI